MKPIFPLFLHTSVNYDFFGCQVEYSLANVAANVFQSLVLQRAVAVPRGREERNDLLTFSYFESKYKY